MAAHIPVLLDRVLETLGDIAGATLVDATFGAGGYSRAFLERGAAVVAFDRDPSVAPFADELKKQYGDKFTFINDKFSRITNHEPRATNHEPRTTHIVFDFGVSSMQIDAPERGFSFRFDAPLDMRMGGGGISARELIEKSSAADLAKILRGYGDVRRAGAIARAIKNAPPETTFQLRDLVHDPRDVAPVFQALRIAVNDEMREIETALAAVPDMLGPGGVCACITFHSLEDRLVKDVFRGWSSPAGDPRMPIAPAPFRLLRAFRPDESEIAANGRARSSHLRAVRKIANIAQKENV